MREHQNTEEHQTATFFRGLRIPQSIAKETNLREGSLADIGAEEGRTGVRAVRSKNYSLCDLQKDMAPNPSTAKCRPAPLWALRYSSGPEMQFSPIGHHLATTGSPCCP